MDTWTVLGVIAGLLTSTGFLPQIIKGYRTKRLHDVSLLMVAVLGLGMGLWLVYGIVREDVAIIFANALGVALTSTLLVMKVAFERRELAVLMSSRQVKGMDKNRDKGR